ncbi:MAG: WG repeat-containing protein [Bacteroidota bacterium]
MQKFSEGLAAVGLRDTPDSDLKYGYIDKTGKVIIPIQYSSAFAFKNGRARVGLKGKSILLDKQGKTIE